MKDKKTMVAEMASKIEAALKLAFPDEDLKSHAHDPEHMDYCIAGKNFLLDVYSSASVKPYARVQWEVTYRGRGDRKKTRRIQKRFSANTLSEMINVIKDNQKYNFQLIAEQDLRIRSEHITDSFAKDNDSILSFLHVAKYSINIADNGSVTIPICGKQSTIEQAKKVVAVLNNQL